MSDTPPTTDLPSDTLRPGEPHPAAFAAAAYLRSLPHEDLLKYQEAFASCAIENNRLSEICFGTLQRLMTNQPVSDRYLLGLAWAIRSAKDGK